MQVSDTSAKLELWFFRDMLESNRLRLFGLFGFKPSEMDTLAKQQMVFRRILDALSVAEPVKTAPAVAVTYTQAECDEMCEIAERDGYEKAVQEIDQLTGGDGEYRVSMLIGGGVDDERHTPGPVEMIQRIVDRFETLNLINGAEKRGDFWDAPGSAQVQDVAVPTGWKMVPRQLTPEMAAEINLTGTFAAKALQARYNAMLAASPTPPAEKEGGE